MSIPAWGKAHRWPNKPIEIQTLSNTSGLFAFGHIPLDQFNAELLNGWMYREDRDENPRMAARHEWWHLKHDLSGEFGFIYTRKAGPGPFVAPVTVWGDS